MAKKTTVPTIEFNSYQNPMWSAMWPAPFFYKKRLFKSIEHMFQFYSLDPSEKETRTKILDSFDPYKVKFFGSKKHGAKERKDQKSKRYDTMKIAIRESYLQNPIRLLALLETKGRLVHLADWDKDWGTGKDGKGADAMGRMLTEFRDSFKGKKRAEIIEMCVNHSQMRMDFYYHG